MPECTFERLAVEQSFVRVVVLARSEFLDFFFRQGGEELVEIQQDRFDIMFELVRCF